MLPLERNASVALFDWCPNRSHQNKTISQLVATVLSQTESEVTGVLPNFLAVLPKKVYVLLSTMAFDASLRHLALFPL